jgi:hypothetical protein
MMSIDSKQIFDELLSTIGSNHMSLPKELLTAFVGMRGSMSNGELVVVGRAVNGWAEGRYAEGFGDAVGRSAIVDVMFNQSQIETQSCPMKWLAVAWSGPRDSGHPYNAKKSAFWQMVQAVAVEQLEIAKPDDHQWTSHLGWTNLYKVSPFCGGNPSQPLRTLQLDPCRRLLKTELVQWHPKRILMLTGLDWAKPFLDSLNAHPTLTSQCRFVEAVGTFLLPGTHKPTKLIVAKHPQRKPRQEFVSEIRLQGQTIAWTQN